MSMWNLKFNVKNVDNIYSHLTEKYDVVDYFYPIDKYKKGKHIYIFSIHVLFGDEKEKEGFVRELRKNKKIKEFDHNANRIMMLSVEEEKFYELLFDQELYFPKPVVIKNGVEEWDIASWDRKTN